MTYKVYANNRTSIPSLGIYEKCYIIIKDGEQPSDELGKEVFLGSYELCLTWVDIHCIDCRNK
jgi:hypothetical protein